MTEAAMIPIDAIDPVPEPKGRNNAQYLQRETEAARVLREQLIEIAGDDDVFIHDTLEGETSLHELITKVMEDVAADEANLAGIKAHIETMQARKKRIEARIDVCRSAILNAMSIGEIKKMELAICTLSRKPVPPSVQIIDEAVIPSEFWKRSDPKLDKKAIGEALKEKREIPGATLSNGGETLAIRFG